MKNEVLNLVSHPEITKLQNFITVFYYLYKYSAGTVLRRAAAVIKGLQ